PDVRLAAPRLRSLAAAGTAPAGVARELVRGRRLLPVGRSPLADRDRMGSGGVRHDWVTETPLSMGRRGAQRVACGPRWARAWLHGRGGLAGRRQCMRLSSADRQCLGMDAERFLALSRLRGRPVSRVFAAMVCHAQGPAWWLLGDARPTATQYLAQLLQA